MSGLLLALPFLVLSGLLVMGLNWFIGGGPAKFHDLTRPHDYVHQVTRAPNNELSVSAFRTRYEAGGHNARPVPVRPEPVQLHGWEDDGGATV